MSTVPRRSGHRHRLLSVTAAALVVLVALPAYAAYTGIYTPTQAVTPRQLLTPQSFTCTGGSSTHLSWTNTEGTATNIYGNPVISGYSVERSINGGAFGVISTPAANATSATDNDFGLLGVGTQITYRLRSTKSTNWVSAYTNTVTASVTVVLFIKNVNCPV